MGDGDKGMLLRLPTIEPACLSLRMDSLGISYLGRARKEALSRLQLVDHYCSDIVAIVSIAVALSGDSVWGVASDLYRLGGEMAVR